MDGTLKQIKSYAGATGRDLHIDAPLSNITIGYRPRGLIAPDLYPLVQVPNQSGVYYVWTSNEFLRVPSARRSPGTPAKRIQFAVSSNTYFAQNFALAQELPYEDISNADAALSIRESAANRIVDGLSLAWEDRLAVTLTTTTNMGSSTSLTNRWNDHVNGAPVEDFFAGKESIRTRTGYDPNVWLFSGFAWARFARHPDVIKYIRGAGDNVGGGSVTQQQVANAFQLDKVLIGKGIKNTGDEGAPAVYTDIWSTAAVLLYVAPTPGLMEPSHGYTFWWQPEGFPGRSATERRRDDNPKVEVVETHQFQAEQVTAAEFGYLIVNA
jgi:hypothetical protein